MASCWVSFLAVGDIFFGVFVELEGEAAGERKKIERGGFGLRFWRVIGRRLGDFGEGFLRYREIFFLLRRYFWERCWESF